MVPKRVLQARSSSLRGSAGATASQQHQWELQQQEQQEWKLQRESSSSSVINCTKAFDQMQQQKCQRMFRYMTPTVAVGVCKRPRGKQEQQGLGREAEGMVFAATAGVTYVPPCHARDSIMLLRLARGNTGFCWGP